MSSNQKVKQLRDKLNHHTKLMGAEMDVEYVNMLLDKIIGEFETEPIDVTHEFDEKHYKETLELHETAINAIMDESKSSLLASAQIIADLEQKLEQKDRQHKAVLMHRDMKIKRLESVETDYHKLKSQYTEKFAEWKTYDEKQKSKFNEKIAEFNRKMAKLKSIDREYKMEDGTTLTFNQVLEKMNSSIVKYNDLLRVCNQGGRVNIAGVGVDRFNKLMAERNKLVKDYNSLAERYTTLNSELDVMRIDMNHMKKDTTPSFTFGGGGGDCEGLKRTIQTMTREHATKIEELKTEIRKLKRPSSSTQHLPSVKYDKLLDEHKELNKKYDALKSRCGDAKADISSLRQIEHLTNELKQRDERIKELRTACIMGQDC